MIKIRKLIKFYFLSTILSASDSATTLDGRKLRCLHVYNLHYFMINPGEERDDGRIV